MPAALLRLSVSLALAFFCLTLSPASAQGSVRFDPHEHLEGYEEAFLGDYSDVYDFTAFEERRGQRLTRAELDAVVALWTAEHRRATVRISAIESDPKERFLYERDRRLNRSNFFRWIEVERVDTFDPIFFYVQTPPKAQPGYAQRVAGQLGPWVRELERVFDEEYVVPYGLERRPDSPAYGIVVFATQGSYTDYAQAVREPGLYMSQAHYDPELRLALTYRDAFGASKGDAERRRPFLHEMVHALQDAFAPSGLPQEVWLNEGLAEYLSYHEGDDPACLRAHPLNLDTVQRVAPFTQPRVAEALLSLPILAGVTGYGAAIERISERLDRVELGLRPELALALTYAQSELWMHYLHQGRDGALRATLGRYFASAQAGRGGPEKLAETFDGVDFDELRRGYLAYIRENFERANPGVALPELVEANATGNAMQPASEGAPATFDPRALAAPDTAELRFARLLRRARDGAFGEAAAGVRALLADAAGDPVADRAGRELERLEAMVALRRRFLQRVATSGKKVRLRQGDAWLIAKVEGVDGDRARLGSNRLKVDSLELDTIDGAELVALMNDSQYGFDERGWLLAYPATLAGSAEDAERFADRSEDSQALTQDAADLAQRVRSAEVADQLAEVAAKGVPEGDPAAAEQAFDLARRALVEDGELPYVRDRRGALLSLARHALERQSVTLDVTEGLAGKVEQLGGGRLRITYAFDDPKEAEDFVPIASDYPLGHLRENSLPSVQATLEVRRKRLTATGLACSRHKLTLRDASVQYTVVVQQPFSSRGGLYQVGLSDDGYGNFLLCTCLGTLLVMDKPTATVRQIQGEMQQLLGQVYHLALKNDGKFLAFELDGRERGKVLVEPRHTGAVILSVASESPVEFDDLVIEGVVTDEARAGMREAWITERMRDLEAQ